jgi:hypothetical protein
MAVPFTTRRTESQHKQVKVELRKRHSQIATSTLDGMVKAKFHRSEPYVYMLRWKRALERLPRGVIPPADYLMFVNSSVPAVQLVGVGNSSSSSSNDGSGSREGRNAPKASIWKMARERNGSSWGRAERDQRAAAKKAETEAARMHKSMRKQSKRENETALLRAFAQFAYSWQDYGGKISKECLMDFVRPRDNNGSLIFEEQDGFKLQGRLLTRWTVAELTTYIIDR